MSETPRLWPSSSPTATGTACWKPLPRPWLAARPGSASDTWRRAWHSAPPGSPRRCCACWPRRMRRTTMPSPLGVDLSAGDASLVRQIAAAAEAVGRPARLHLKADTGMSRGGAPMANWPDLVDVALAEQAAGRCEIVGIWSHLACADMPGHPSVDTQLAAFRDALDVAEPGGRAASGAAPGQHAGPAHPPRHLVRPGQAGRRGNRAVHAARRCSRLATAGHDRPQPSCSGQTGRTRNRRVLWPSVRDRD